MLDDNTSEEVSRQPHKDIVQVILFYYLFK